MAHRTLRDISDNSTVRGRVHRRAKGSLFVAGMVGICSSVLGLFVTLGGCEPDLDSLLSGNTSSTTTSNAGTSSSSATTGTGGTSSSSATTGTGGTSSSSASSGATTSSTSATGSTSSSGTASSTTGTASSSSGTANADAGRYEFTFDTDFQGWSGRSYDADMAGPTVTWSMLGNNALGSADGGAAMGTMTFTPTGTTRYVRYAPTLNGMSKQDLTGRTVTLWAYVQSTTVPIQLAAFVQADPNVTFVRGATTSVNPGDAPKWVQLSVMVPTPSASWDPTVTNQFGLQVVGNVGDGGDGAVIAVDDCVVQ